MYKTHRQITINQHIYSDKEIDLLQEKSEPENSWQNQIYSFIKNWFDESETIECQTSGSTGMPKKILLKKSAMYHSAIATNAFFELDKNSTALLCLPASYIAGKMMLIRAIAGQFNINIVEPSKNPVEKINFPVDFVAITPYQLVNSVQNLKTVDVKKIIVGGGQLNNQAEEIANVLNSKVYETYGMTETASHIALRRVNGSEKSDYFTLLKGISIDVDEQKRLLINAPYISDNKLITNDIVEIIDKHNFRWLGRADRVINSGGIKIFPEQIEKKIKELISENYFIARFSDETLGEKAVLVIEGKKKSDNEIELLQKRISQQLERYEIPKRIIFVPNFIYSESGKILIRETIYFFNPSTYCL